MSTKAKGLLIILFSCLAQLVSAQNLTRSPYSALGPGDLQFTGSAWMSAMGQTGQGLASPYLINNQNPASYHSMRYTLFDVAARGSVVNMKSASGSSQANTSSFAYFAMAFPLVQRLGWGAGFGFAPFSATGYNISRSVTRPGVSGTEYLKGNGGVSQVYFGSGIRLLKTLSAGVNVSYLFGQNNYQNFFSVQSSDTMFNLLEERKRNTGDFRFEIGLQYVDSFYYRKDSSKYQWGIGLTVSPQQDISITDNYNVRTMPFGSLSPTSGGGLGKDTIVSRNDVAGRITLPMMVRGGIHLQKVDAWTLALDVGYYNWAEYRALGQRDSLKNTLSIGLGGSFIPNSNALKGYLNFVEYKAGIRYDNGNLNVKGNNINTIGISAGVGLPLARFKTKLNITGEYIMRGTTASQLIREDYFAVTIGVVICDREWFRKYRYD